jgi:hypothetical protein
MSANVRYSDSERQAVAKGLREGRSYSEIAVLLGRDRRSVAHQGSLLGVTRAPVWTDEDFHTAATMRAKGVSYARIGKAVGRSASAVQEYLTRHAKRPVVAPEEPKTSSPPVPPQLVVQPEDVYTLWCRAMARVRRSCNA